MDEMNSALSTPVYARFGAVSTPCERASTSSLGSGRQLTENESVLRVSVLPTAKSEGRPRANESGPLTIPTPLNGREVDASMPTHLGPAHPASPSSEQRPPTEPVLLRDCFVDVLAELVARENVHNVINNADADSEED